MGGSLPVDSAIFLGMSGATVGVPGSLVDCLWDFNYRIYTHDTPISTDGLVCLVGLRLFFSLAAPVPQQRIGCMAADPSRESLLSDHVSAFSLSAF